MIYTRNATLVHFKQSKLSAEYIIHQRKKGDWAILMFVQSYFHPFFNFSPESIRKSSLYIYHCTSRMRSQSQLRNDKYIMMQYTNWINSTPSQQ